MFTSILPSLAIFSLCALPPAAAHWLPETLDSPVATCIVPKNTGGEDDSPSVTATVSTCDNSSRVVFAGNETYHLLTPVAFTGLADVEFVINGHV